MNSYYTAGYQKIRINDFIEMLKKVSCKTLYDIRTYPKSRNPCYGDRFRAFIEGAGIKYVWAPKLGGKKKFSKQIRKEALPRSFEGNVVFMCFEDDIKDCHRKEIAALMQEVTGQEVPDLNAIRNAETVQPELFA